MPVDLKRLLSTALSEIEREEEHDALEARFKALEERKPQLSLSNIVDALENASDDELAALDKTVLAPLVREAREGEESAAGADGQGGGGGAGSGSRGQPPPPARKTRPGRRSGQVYDWWVDDEGKVFKLDGPARVYTGTDEPDEVELPEETEGGDKE